MLFELVDSVIDQSEIRKGKGHDLLPQSQHPTSLFQDEETHQLEFVLLNSSHDTTIDEMEEVGQDLAHHNHFLTPSSQDKELPKHV